MAIVGVEKLYYALLTKDNSTGLIYEEPVYLPGVKSFSVAPKVSASKLYAENTLWDQETTIDEITVGVNIADLSNEDSAILLGQQLAAEGGVYASEGDNPPYVALLYKANKRNKQARYQVLYKGKFSLPEEKTQGQEGKTDFQTPVMSGLFQVTKFNGRWKYQVDTDDIGCPEDIDTSFFEDVIIPTKKKSVAGVSLSPESATGTAGTAGDQQFTATVSPVDASIKNITFAISPATEGLTIDAEGLAEWTDAVAAAVYTVTVTTDDGDKTATATLELTS